MKFTARAGDLRQAIDDVSRVVPRVPSQAVYGGIRLRVRDGHLTVTGSSEGSTTITVTVDVTSPVAGDRVLAPKPIAAYLSALPASTVLAVSATSSELVVHPVSGSPYTFRLMEATFPNTSVPAAHTYSTDLSRLSAAVRAVKGCATKTKLVQLVSGATGVHLYATDGLRLASAGLPEASFGEFTGLLPVSVLDQIGEQAMTEVALDRRMRTFTASNAHRRVTTRVDDEAFPAVSAVLEHQKPTQDHILPVRPLMERLNRLASVAAGRPVLIHIAGDRVTLSGDELNTGSGAEHLELDEPVNADITIAVNLDFLRDALAAHPAATIRLGWTTSHTPLFLTSDEVLPVTTVVMPLRV